MAETRLTNIITPDVFTDYTIENWSVRNRFFQSGAVVDSPQIGALLDGGGKLFEAPFWQNLTGDSEIPVEATPQTVNSMSALQSNIRRQVRTKAWGANALTNIQAGSKALDVFAQDVKDYWNGQYNTALIASAVGVLNNNVEADGGDLLNDQAAVSFTASMVFDSMALLGENGVAGRSDSTDFKMIIVHSIIYNSMQKAGLINTDYVSADGIEVPVPIYSFAGLEVIVDDGLTVASGVCTSILCKAGAFQFGTSTMNFEPTSFERVEGRGFGVDEVYTRRCFAVSPVGQSWTEDDVAGTSPTFAELKIESNWDRVYAKANSKIVFLNSLK